MCFRGSELISWLGSQDLVVNPSRWLETGPLTLLEAWDCGTPVIGTDMGGIREFMTSAGHSEMLFKNEDHLDLAIGFSAFYGGLSLYLQLLYLG